MSSTAATASARSLVPLPPSGNFRQSGRTNGALPPGDAPRFQRAPTKGHHQRISKKVPKPKRGTQRPLRRHNNDYPKHSVLLHRLSLPSSSPSSTLLERIGGSAEVEAASDSDRGDRVSEGADDIITDLPFSTIPHVYTPEPGEVERFLESIIGAPPPLPDPVHARLGNKPSRALEPVEHLVTVQDPFSSVPYSPLRFTVDSPSSVNLTLDHCPRSPFLGDTMPPPSPSTIDECRKHLAPVLLAVAQARNSEKRLDSEQCLRLLSDDRCRNLFRQAKEMKLQLSSLASQQAPTIQGRSRSPKRDRVDAVDARAQSTRSRFDSANTVVSRKDSDITLVDFAGGKLPPKAPRAMLQASQARSKKPSIDARDEVPYKALPVVASPTTEDHPPGATSLIELAHQPAKVFPTFMPTSQAETETGAPGAGDQPMPDQVVSPAHAQTSTDFVSHLPTQPGIWFRQQGRQYAEVLDVHIDVSDDMFYMSTERRPCRLRMHLRLCSVSVGAMTDNGRGDALPASLQDLDRHVLHWPKKGKLVVQVNPESERSATWLAYTLESDPLDVTACMRPGKNTFRFIQLSDLSEFTFVLAASPPPPEEDAWRSLDWASLVEGPRMRSSSSAADVPMHGLAEFAHLPVTVRS